MEVLILSLCIDIRLTLLFAVLAAIIGVTLALTHPSVWQLLIGQGSSSGPLAVQASLWGRLELWNRAIRMVEDYPYTGVGLHAFLPMLLRSFAPLIIDPSTYNPHPHDMYLAMATDFGLGGSIAFLAIWAGTVARASLRLWQTASQPRSRDAHWAMLACLTASLSGFLVYGVTDAIEMGSWASIVLWIFPGLTMAASVLTDSGAAVTGQGVQTPATEQPDGRATESLSEAARWHRLERAAQFSGDTSWCLAILVVLGDVVVNGVAWIIGHS